MIYSCQKFMRYYRKGLPMPWLKESLDGLTKGPIPQ